MDKITAQNNGSIKDYIASLDEQTGKDSQVLIEMMQRISGHEPKLWNGGTIGFDTYHYKYDSGREGDGHVLGFYLAIREDHRLPYGRYGTLVFIAG